MNEASPIPTTQAIQEDSKAGRSMNFSTCELDSEGQIMFTKEKLKKISKYSKPEFKNEPFNPIQAQEVKTALEKGGVEEGLEDRPKTRSQIPHSSSLNGR